MFVQTVYVFDTSLPNFLLSLTHTVLIPCASTRRTVQRRCTAGSRPSQGPSWLSVGLAGLPPQYVSRSCVQHIATTEWPETVFIRNLWLPVWHQVVWREQCVHDRYFYCVSHVTILVTLCRLACKGVQVAEMCSVYFLQMSRNGAPVLQVDLWLCGFSVLNYILKISSD